MFTHLFRRLPAVARRDATISALLVERGRPSFFAKLCEARRLRERQSLEAERAPVWQLNDKASGYRFALSHGVPIPHIYGEYARARDIDWASLPREFVIKSISGTASLGVLPLIREDGGIRDVFDEGRSYRSEEDILSRLEDLHAQGKASSELLIEELLRAPKGSGLKVLPDYKLFCFFGEVGMITTTARYSRGRGGQDYRYFGVDGSDLGAARLGLPINSGLAAPRYLPELLAAGERLSAAISAPFVRVDMYESLTGVIFGEITPAPGGDHIMRQDLDLHLGELWEKAEARLERHAIGAGIREPRFGAQKHRSLTPERRDIDDFNEA